MGSRQIVKISMQNQKPKQYKTNENAQIYSFHYKPTKTITNNFASNQKILSIQANKPILMYAFGCKADGSSSHLMTPLRRGHCTINRLNVDGTAHTKHYASIRENWNWLYEPSQVK